jgi:hypothetical protein
MLPAQPYKYNDSTDNVFPAQPRIVCPDERLNYCAALGDLLEHLACTASVAVVPEQLASPP